MRNKIKIENFLEIIKKEKKENIYYFIMSLGICVFISFIFSTFSENVFEVLPVYLLSFLPLQVYFLINKLKLSEYLGKDFILNNLLLLFSSMSFIVSLTSYQYINNILNIEPKYLIFTIAIFNLIVIQIFISIFNILLELNNCLNKRENIEINYLIFILNLIFILLLIWYFGYLIQFILIILIIGYFFVKKNNNKILMFLTILLLFFISSYYFINFYTLNKNNNIINLSYYLDFNKKLMCYKNNEIVLYENKNERYLNLNEGYALIVKLKKDNNEKIIKIKDNYELIKCFP